jgi:hypothetical protein
MARKKPHLPLLKSTNVLDYPSSMSQYEKESLVLEAKLAEQRQVEKLEKLFNKSK